MVSRRKLERRWLKWERWEERIGKLSLSVKVTTRHLEAWNRVVVARNRAWQRAQVRSLMRGE